MVFLHWHVCRPNHSTKTTGHLIPRKTSSIIALLINLLMKASASIRPSNFTFLLELYFTLSDLLNEASPAEFINVSLLKQLNNVC